ncbi:putative adenine nucleotide alpha hydrolases-like superfamily protein [Tanacetum coccineum]
MFTSWLETNIGIGSQIEGFKAKVNIKVHFKGIIAKRSMSKVHNINGIRCEIAHCEWANGKPKLGHLQEAARDMSYEQLQRICSQHRIGVLLIAHHADDQAELFILRLSRNSGVLGLASMALTTQLFATHSNLDGTSYSILLVWPLLDFTKQDLYKIGKRSKQEWVEDLVG